MVISSRISALFTKRCLGKFFYISSKLSTSTTQGQYVVPFPKDFLFGVATASYQIEGAVNEDGKGENIWDRMIKENPAKIANFDKAYVACDSYHRYKEDVALVANLGCNHYRFSISWTRILPTGRSNKVNEKGIKYYQNLVDEILAHNLIPVATIYHWDLPQPLQDEGGWTNPSLVDHFVDYSRIVINNLKNVEYWVTINEPKQVCVLGYGLGVHAPGTTNTGIDEYLCAYVVMKAHAATYHMYKREFPHYKAKMSIVLDGEWNQPASSKTQDIEAAERKNQFELGLYANPIFNRNWPQVVIDRIKERSETEGYQKSRLPEFTEEELDFISGTYDYFGFNTYCAFLISDADEAELDGQPGYFKDMKVKISGDPSWKKSSDGRMLVPWGARKILKWVKDNYGDQEIFITENGVAEEGSSLDDDIRIEFLDQHLRAILEAMYIDGVRVFGYTVWSLMDNFEWDQGYRQRYGLYYINFTDPELKRIPKKSSTYYRQLATTHMLPEITSLATKQDVGVIFPLYFRKLATTRMLPEITSLATKQNVGVLFPFTTTLLITFGSRSVL